MNISGHGPSSYSNIKFYIEGQQIECCDSYNYLGIILKPSGTASYASKQLLTKANKSYFAMSNILYENKKMVMSEYYNYLTLLLPQYVPMHRNTGAFWVSHATLLKVKNGF